MSHDVSDFTRDVIERSYIVPVLVDFWAPWCGPCKMLKPVLEKLAAEAGGRWNLVKVNTDEHQDLAEQHGIRGIPDVKLFHAGRLAAEFSGALPEYAVRKWLEEHLPSPTRSLLAEVRDKLLVGDFSGAESVLAPLNAAEPGNDEIAALLARARVFRDPRDAAALVERIQSDDADLVRAFAKVLTLDPARLPDFSARLPLLGGLAELCSGRFAEALRLLISSMEEGVRYADGAAKQACLAIFKHLGPRHPIVEEFHRAYSRAANV